MRRLLFVDDEVPILRALERMLRAHRKDWECHFVNDPRRALELVHEIAPDAVVTDTLDGPPAPPASLDYLARIGVAARLDAWRAAGARARGAVAA